MIDTLLTELAIRRAYVEAYPWLEKVRRLPDVGLHDICGLWHGYDAANDDKQAVEPLFAGQPTGAREADT